MKRGPKPKHGFYDLEIGQSIELTGAAAKYPSQYLRYYHQANPGRQLQRQRKSITVTRVA